MSCKSYHLYRLFLKNAFNNKIKCKFDKEYQYRVLKKETSDFVFAGDAFEL